MMTAAGFSLNLANVVENQNLLCEKLTDVLPLKPMLTAAIFEAEFLPVRLSICLPITLRVIRTVPSFIRKNVCHY